MAAGEFVIAKNPEPGSTLPYLLRLPLGKSGIVLKARDTWPRTAKVYCHRAEGWPESPEIVEMNRPGFDGGSLVWFSVPCVGIDSGGCIVPPASIASL